MIKPNGMQLNKIQKNMKFRLFLGLCAALSSILFITSMIEATNVSVAEPGTETSIWGKICKDPIREYEIYFESYDSLAEKLRELPNSEKAKSECPEKFHKSIEDLGRILGSDFYDDVCKRETLEAIYNFHLKHMAKNWRDKIPPNLRIYFTRFADTIVEACLHESELAMSTPEWESQKLPPSQFDLDVLRFAFDNDKFKRFFYDFQEVETIDLLDPQKVLLPQNSVFRQAQEICEARLRPVYEHLVVPILKLISAGYSTRLTVYNIHLFGEVGAFRHETVSIERWYHIMQVCEILKNLDFYIIPQDRKFRYLNWGPLAYAQAQRLEKLRVDDSDKDLKMIDVSNLERKKVKISRSIWNVPRPEMMIKMLDRYNNMLIQKRGEIEFEKLKRHEKLISEFLKGVVAFTG